MKPPHLISRSKLAAVAFLAFASYIAPARAVNPDEMLRDPVLEDRARSLSRDLRCVVCQNQSIDDSNAPLARDLRVLLRERLSAGDTDSQAVGYLVARYGNFILLRPPIQTNTALLWIGPALFLLFALSAAVRYLRKTDDGQPIEHPAPLSADEQARFEALLSNRGSI